MSVLIKGMKMPEKCGSCDLFHVESPMHCTVVKGHKTVGAPYGMPRPDWCPLVEIHEHGRLIDADALIDDIKRDTKKAIDEGDKAGSFWLGYAAGSVIAQPTIQPEKAQLSQEDTTFDTISRQAAIDALQNCHKHCIDPFDSYHIDIQDAENQLSKLPSVQPEAQEGHWIRTDCGLDVECKCSRCGYKDFVEPRDEYWFKRNYCPNCGAKMKGERQK